MISVHSVEIQKIFHMFKVQKNALMDFSLMRELVLVSNLQNARNYAHQARDSIHLNFANASMILTSTRFMIMASVQTVVDDKFEAFNS